MCILHKFFTSFSQLKEKKGFIVVIYIYITTYVAKNLKQSCEIDLQIKSQWKCKVQRCKAKCQKEIVMGFP
jgi:hypothetical protein